MTDFQALLGAAAADPRSPAWTEIWQECCHQGTCYPESAELLPWLARTCAAFPVDDRETIMSLAGFIAVDAADISDGEVDVVCPACGEEWVVDLQSGDPAVTPGLSAEVAVRLHTTAIRAGRTSVATALTHLFGRLTCISCGTTGPLADCLPAIESASTGTVSW